MVVEIRTALAPHALLRHCKHIEAEQGRIEGDRWGPRELDIDILIFNQRVVRTANLIIPHPRLWQRAFVLRPLADLRPDLKSPQGSSILNVLRQDEISSQGIWPYEPTRVPDMHER
jgi:2-amino-4-hydroxy-6-hydroxymethyldihydropteridine diphosphokinase